MNDFINIADAIAFIEMHNPHYARAHRAVLEVFIEAVDRDGRVFFDRERIPITHGQVRLSRVRQALGY